jgi:HAD superfamily hydrolase (TIGR01509 family)
VTGDDGRTAVLFDLDGVLIDSFEAWFRLTNRTRRHLGFPDLERDFFRAHFGQGVEDDLDVFFPGHPFETVDGFFSEHFLDEIEHVVVDPSTIPILGRLGARGHPLAIVTNTRRGLADAMLDALGLAGRVDAVAASGDAPRDKPAPDLVLLACERIGREPARAILVGDSRFDREAAVAAGVPFVGFRTDGPRRIERLVDLPALLDGGAG